MAHTNPAPTSRSRRRLFTIVGSIAVVVVVAGLVFFGLRVTGVFGAPEATPTPTPTPFVTPGPQTPVSLPATATASDSFDNWGERLASDSVRFLASDDAHDGSTSLLVTSTAPAGATAAILDAPAYLHPTGRYVLTAWVKSAGGEEGAVTLQPGWTGAGNLVIPGGAYDWTQVSYEFVAGSAVTAIIVYVKGSTEGVLIDSVDIQPIDGNGVPTFHNGGFDENSADLAITNESLLLETGEAELNLATRRASEGWLEWTALDADGKAAATGNATFAANVGTIDMSDMGPGYYTLEVSAHVGGELIERSTPFGIVDRIEDAEPLAESRYGIHLHDGVNPTKTSNMISTLASMGIGHVRADTPWNQIEKTGGQYEYPSFITEHMAQYAELGMDALQVPVYVNRLYDGGVTPSSEGGLAAYGAFTSNVLTTFAHAGQDVEVYNEFDHSFNNGACGKSAACYIQMLDAVNQAVRPVAPDATIVGPGNAGMGFKWDWLNDFIAQGGLDRIDVVSAHPYTQPEPASTMGEDIDRLREMIRAGNGGKDKPIWLTEMGWATVPDWVSDQEQAEYLVQMTAAALGHGVERVYWYEAVDQRAMEQDIEGNFGLFENDRALLVASNAPKRSAIAQSVIASRLNGLEPASIDSLGPQVESYVFGGKGGKGDRSERIMWATDKPTEISISSKEPIVVTDIYGVETTITPKKGSISITLTTSPIYISGDVENLTRVG